MADIADWLTSMGLAQYADAFASESIELSIVSMLSDQDLKDLGVGLMGHRRKILAAAASLALQPPASDPPPKPVRREEAERRPITVMFCDLVGSTRMAATLDAEDWRDLVGAYLDDAARAIGDYDGYVLKKLGDGLMALFGYPRAQENDAERAARAGLAILRAIEQLNARNASRGLPALAARIGLESGPVVVDATGEVFGDTPNVAARVQSAAEPGSLFVTAGVQRQIAGLFVAEDAGAHELKGVTGRPTLYRIVRASGSGRRAASRALTPLVGREEELAELSRRWTRTQSGEGQFVLVVGEPGLGKSRLIEEFRSRLGETPHTWIDWSASQLLQNTPLHPVLEWGRQRFSGEKRLAELEAALAAVGLDPAEYAPLLASLLDIPLSQDFKLAIAADELRRRQLAASLAWLVNGARAQPLVLAFEDLHWADPTTLDLMKTLAERGGQAPLMIVATTRPEFRASWATRSHHCVVSLAPLAREQIRAMIDAIAERHALSKDMIEGVGERTGGVPLFVEEVTRLLLEGGALTIPPTLQQSLAARLDRLGDAREVAQIGAVLGREFSYELLASVAASVQSRAAAEPPPSTARDYGLDAELEKLVDADLLFVDGIAPAATYRFKHALIQDAAYESLLKSRRQALHRSAAKSLVSGPDLQPELVAHHLTQAGDTEAAIEWWSKAGNMALKRSAFQEAIAHLGRAIEMGDRILAPSMQQSENSVQAEINVKYAQSLLFVKGQTAPETTAAFGRIAKTTSSDAEQRWWTIYGEFNKNLIAGLLPAALENAREQLREAEAANLPVRIAQARRSATAALYFLGEFAKAREESERALALPDGAWKEDYRFGSGIDFICSLKGAIAPNLFALGEVDNAENAIAEAKSRAEELAHPFSEAFVLVQQCIVLSISGRFDAVGPCAEALLALGGAHRFGAWNVQGKLFRAWALAAISDPETGYREMFEAHNDIQLAGAQLMSPVALMVMAECKLKLGELDEALALIVQSIDYCTQHASGFLLSFIHSVRGDILLAHNKNAAETAYREALAISCNQGARSLTLVGSIPLSRLLQADGRLVEAHDVLANALEGFSASPAFPAVAASQALLEDLTRELQDRGEIDKRKSRTELQARYAQAMLFVKGQTAPATQAAFGRIAGSSSSADAEQRWWSTYGEFHKNIYAGLLPAALENALEQLRNAEAVKAPARIAQGRRSAASTKYLMGDFTGSLNECELALALPDGAWKDDYREQSGYDFTAQILATLAPSLWMLGEVAKADQIFAQAMERADELGNPVSQAFVMAQRGMLLSFADRFSEALSNANLLIALTEAHQIGAWDLNAKLFRGWALGCLSDAQAGLLEVRSVYEAIQNRGAHILTPVALMALAELESKSKATDEALSQISRCVEISARQSNGFMLMAALGERGEILAQFDPAASEAAFRESIAIARQQRARSAELLQTVALARLLRTNSRLREAREILEAALEGFDASPALPAIAEGQALLASLKKLTE